MVRVRIQGEAALFANPHFRADPISYPVPTPSALKGILRAMYWKPEFEWEIRAFYVMKPIRFDTFTVKNVKKVGNSDRTLSTITHLVDVDYIVDAEAVANPLRTEFGLGRFEQEFRRRMEAGQAFTAPYLGRKEYTAAVSTLSLGQPVEAEDTSRALGRMLFDLVPVNHSEDAYKAIFYSPQMRHGKVNVPVDLYNKHRRAFFESRLVHAVRSDRPGAVLSGGAK